MVVQHNLQAMNANRMLNVTTSQQSKSTEKLSSGYKINRAADDAAGLSISEKMRKQMRGLDRASTNAQDGVSAVQTAEGALTEVHSMLQRMNELAVQASNGTNSETDRQSIQDEIDQLTTEIDRVAETTKFNETYLLKGNAKGTTKTNTVAAHDAGLAGKLTDNGDGITTFKLNDKLENGSKVTIAGKEYTIGEAKSKDSYDLASTLGILVLKAGDSVTASGVKTTLTTDIARGDVATAKIGNTNYAAGDTITAADGTVYTYHAAGATATAGFYKDGDWADDATGAAKKVDATTIGLSGATYYNAANKTTHQIVDDLADGEKSTLSFADLKAATVKGSALAAGDSVTISGETTSAVAAGFTPTDFEDVKKGIEGSAAGKTVTIASLKGTGSKTYTIVENGDEEDVANNKLTRESIIAKIKEGDQVTYSDKAGTSKTATAAGVDPLVKGTITTNDAYKLMADELQKASSIGTDAGKAAKVTDKGNGVFEIKQGTVEVKDALSFSLHVGADADMTNKINVDIDTMSAAGLGIKGLNVKDDSGVAATYAIDAIADAVAKVSAQRSALGAVQNRLEHTIANVDNVVENTTSAESRIRDTDMAEEMVEYSKNNILAQAGQSMLAQANQSNQGVLSLLG